MPWHASKSDPRKVYDSYHNAVCVCQNQDQANLIVAAVNAFGAPDAMAIKLREPSPAGKESAKEPEQTCGASLPGHNADAPPTHAWITDGCCDKALRKASLSGNLDGLQPFECSKCGTTYWPRREGPVVNWEARANAVVFKT